MTSYLNRLKSLAMLLMVTGFLTGMSTSFSSCSSSGGENTETTEGDEHPEGEEHPSDDEDEEHPEDSEHPEEEESSE